MWKTKIALIRLEKAADFFFIFQSPSLLFCCYYVLKGNQVKKQTTLLAADLLGSMFYSSISQ